VARRRVPHRAAHLPCEQGGRREHDQLDAEAQVAAVDDRREVLVVEDLVVHDVVLTEAATEHG
jgi:hypothetical protein